MIDAVSTWDEANGSIDFTIVESDADVNVSWNRFMPASRLGLYSAQVSDAGDRERHSISIRLGIDDCHSEYRPFAHDALKYVIAHEMGHYLGLRHVDDKNHLMHSGELFDVDPARVYDEGGLYVPTVAKPVEMTIKGQSIQSEIDALLGNLDDVTEQRQAIKETEEAQALEDNTKEYNRITAQISGLEDELVCLQL